jgi:hypothetical protein
VRRDDTACDVDDRGCRAFVVISAQGKGDEALRGDEGKKSVMAQQD